MNGLKIFINRRHYYIAAGLVIISLLLKYVYIFHFTSFRDSLHNDMASYWQGSLLRAWGDQTSIGQWGSFTPFYKYYVLAPFFHLLNSYGFLPHALSLVILMNILVYGISAWFFYLIVERLITHKPTALIALIFYSFSYLATYINALVLPDSLAVSLVVISTGLIILTTRRRWIFIAGLLLGIAIADKPFLVVFSPAFMWYLFSRSPDRRRLGKIMIFVVALIVVPLVTLAENYHVSHGKLKSLAAIGGINFFQGWGKVGRVFSSDTQAGGWFYSPGAIDEPSWKPVNVKEAWYNQGYFYRLGIKSIVQNPSVLLEKIFWFKKFFWGALGPSLVRIPAGYNQIMPVFSCVYCLMFLGLGLYFFIRPYENSKTILFLFSLLGLFFIFIYICGMPERRYFLNIEFLVVALFFVTLNGLMSLYRVYRREICIYALFIFAFFICIPATWEQLSKLLGLSF